MKKFFPNPFSQGEPVIRISQVSEDFEVTAICEDDRCTCLEGFESNADGICIKPEVTDLPVVNADCDFSTYPSRQDINMADFISHSCQETA